MPNTLSTYKKANKLDDVCYDIRGPVLEAATKLEADGKDILKLNIGNPAPFGFHMPEEIAIEMKRNLSSAEGYSDSKGLLVAREAILQESVNHGVRGVTPNDIIIGNGVSELITMSMQALLNIDDEILLPSPDYPLWTAAVTLSGGKAVHYVCDEASSWQPDLNDIISKITPRTKGLVLINPNNPTGAVYSTETLTKLAKIAHEKNLILFADEIYSKILFDQAQFTPMAKVAQNVSSDLLCVSFDGLSKNYRIPGFRCGWMTLTGNKQRASSYIEGLNMLASMRLCSNVPSMLCVKNALEGDQCIYDLTGEEGRLFRQRELAYTALNKIDGVSCVKPDGAFYFFPKIDVKKFNIKDDEKFVLDFLIAHNVLLVHGTAFNWANPDHFRVVFLPEENTLLTAIERLGSFLDTYKQQ